MLKDFFQKYFHIYDILQYNSMVNVIFLPHLKMKNYIKYLKKVYLFINYVQVQKL